jgi:ribosomal protein S18 acetylase RimI-like enzyme
VPALIERFVNGREVNVSLIERNGEVEVLPLAEIEFVDYAPGQPRIVGYRAKWVPDSFEYRNTPRRIPASVPDDVADRLRECARQAWEALDCRDYARVDFRLDDDLQPYVLEVNANPDISPDAGFTAALAAAGVPYAEFVASVVRNALNRLPEVGMDGLSPPAAELSGKTIRRSGPEDRDAILHILVRTGAFRPDEVAVARDVLENALSAGPDGHYQSYTALADGRVAGWVCFGATPCTLGTFDLYWLAVDPQVQGCGVGRTLVEQAEKAVARVGGRMVIVETSGRPAYESARRFYLKLGYNGDARLLDFYAPGDDKVVYVKRLSS